MLTSIFGCSVLVVGMCFISVNCQTIFIRNGQIPVKGGTIQIVCANVLSTDKSVGIYKTNSQSIGLGSELDSCLSSGCISGKYDRYQFNVEQNNLIITITNLSIIEDQRWWSCSGGGKFVQIQLVVYSLPTTLSLIDAPNKVEDLALTDVTFTCRANCSNPDPNITWFFTQVGQSKSKWSGSVSQSSSDRDCSISEKTYSSTLLLPKFTTLSDNSDTYGTFECAVIQLPGMTGNLTSGSTQYIYFAVKVTNARLQEGNSSLIEVIMGDNTTLNCILNNHKPAATVVWYIGSDERQSSTSTTFRFIPNENDHNKQVYCKAFNFERQDIAVSSGKPFLYVKVKVTTAIIKDSAMNSTTSIVVTANQSKTVNCVINTSRPAPTIVWYIGDTEKTRSTSDTLTFIPTDDDHDKQIYCKAFNIQPESAAVQSNLLKLFVKVLAIEPKLNIQTPLLSGDTSTLECLSSTTRPPVTVVWKLNNMPLTDFKNTQSNLTRELFIVRSLLNLTANNNDNNQFITCETYVDGQEIKPQAKAQMQVYWPPSEPSISPVDTFPWLAGVNNNLLNCVSKDVGNPSADTIWNTTVGQPVGEKLRSLQIQFLTSKHNGFHISCLLTNEYTQRKGLQLSARTTLIVEYLPEIQILVGGLVSVNVTRNESNSLSAMCSANGNPVPKAHWIGRPGQELVFDNIKRTDDGLYRCEANATSLKHGEMSSTKELNVIVNYAPNVSVEFSDILKEDVRLTVSCRAIGKPGIYTFANLTHTWKGQTIQVFNLPPDGLFSLPNPTIQDSGNYTCFVSNGVPDRSGIDYQYGTAEAILKGKPKVSKKAESLFAGKIGEPFNITIPFYSYPPVKVVLFRTKNGTNITNSSKYEVSYSKQRIVDVFYQTNVELDGYIAVLHIRKQDEDDFINYVVDIENVEGTTEWQFRHTSKSIPMVPKNFKLSGIENGVLFFILEGGFNGGLPQTFIIETSITGSNKWVERLRFQEDDVQYRQSNGSYLFNISGLGPETYAVRVISENDIGRIEDSQGLTLDVIIEGPAKPQHQLPVAAIGGATGSAFVIICVVVAVFIVWKKRSHYKGESRTKLHGKHKENADDNSDDEVVENLAYVSADEVKTTTFGGSPNAIYSQPDKKSASGKGESYAVSQKTNGEDPSNLYAQPEKKAAKLKKHKTKSGARPNENKTTSADVYENAEPVVQNKPHNYEENLYENPATNVTASLKKNINKDGLIYADLAFNDQPKGQKKLVIHGLDDMTVYGKIDFTKKAEPLPDSDEETNDKQ